MVFDTDVLIWAVRRHPLALEMIEGDTSRAVSVATCMEFLVGARNKQELAALRGFLNRFERLPLTEEIGNRAQLYIEQHTLKIALSPMDALIAATACENNFPLCTANVKHYRAMPSVEVVPFRP